MDALAREGVLAPEWTPARGADMLWAMISIPAWEFLTQDRRWSTRQWIRHMQDAARRTFVAAD
jgi:hypothetical protein